MFSHVSRSAFQPTRPDTSKAALHPQGIDCEKHRCGIAGSKIIPKFQFLAITPITHLAMGSIKKSRALAGLSSLRSGHNFSSVQTYPWSGLTDGCKFLTMHYKTLWFCSGSLFGSSIGRKGSPGFSHIPGTILVNVLTPSARTAVTCRELLLNSHVYFFQNSGNIGI